MQLLPQPLQCNKFQRLARPTVFKGLQAYTVCPPLNLLNPLHRPSRSQDTPVQLFLRVFKAAVCPALNPLNPAGPTRQALLPAEAKATAPSIQQIPAVGTPNCFSGSSSLPCAPLNVLNPLNPPSRSQDRPRPTVFKGVQGCRLPGLKLLKPSKPSAGPPGKPYVQQLPRPQPLQFNKFQRLARPTVFQGLQAYRLPALKASKPPKPSQPQPGQATSNCF